MVAKSNTAREFVAKNESQSEASHLAPGEYLTTEEFANALSLRAQTVRKRLSQTGSYYGARPLRLPNRMLRWPTEHVMTLLARKE